MRGSRPRTAPSPAEVATKGTPAVIEAKPARVERVIPFERKIHEREFVQDGIVGQRAMTRHDRTEPHDEERMPRSRDRRDPIGRLLIEAQAFADEAAKEKLHLDAQGLGAGGERPLSCRADLHTQPRLSRGLDGRPQYLRFGRHL